MSGTTTDWFNVMSYGAVGDGTTDDTTAIQSAFSAASTASGGTVYFPTGTYLVSDALSVPTGTVIQGDSMNVSVIHQSSTTADTLSATDQRYISIHDIQLKGPSSGSGRGIALLYSSSPLASISVENVIVQNFGGDGVHIEEPITSTITNVRSQNNGGHGFFCNNGTSVTFQACYANADTGNGYELDAMNYCALNACAADNVATGYAINGCSAIVLNGCGSEQPVNGYKVYGASANISILCCKVLGETGIGFWLTGNSIFNFMIGCREAFPGVGATASVQVDSGSTATSINPETTTAVNFAAGSTNFFQATNLEIHSAGSATARVGRGANTNTGRYTLQTGSSDKWAMQLNNDSTDNLHLTDLQHSLDAFVAVQQATQPNIGLLTGSGSASYGGGTGVVFLANASSAPSSNPSGGGVLYANTGTLQWRDPNGSIASLLPNSLAPTNATGETCTRAIVTATSSATLTSGMVYVRGILLPAGTAINNIALFTAAGNVVTQANLTHGWYALLDKTLTVRAVSANQASVPFLTATNTPYSLSVSGSSYTTTYAGLYYIAVSVSVSAGNMPQFAVSGSLSTGVGSTAPVLQGTAGTQAAPPTVGTQLASGTTTFSNSNAFYGYTS